MGKPVAVCSECHMGLLETVDNNDNPTYYCSTCNVVTKRVINEPKLVAFKHRIIGIIAAMGTVILASAPAIIIVAILIWTVGGIGGCIHQQEIDASTQKVWVFFIKDSNVDKDLVINKIKKGAIEAGIPFKVIDRRDSKNSFVIKTTKEAISNNNTYTKDSRGYDCIPYIFREFTEVDKEQDY